MPYRILGPKGHPHSAPFQTVLDACMATDGVAQIGLTHVIPALWNAASELDIDGVGLVAQSWLETNRWTFLKPDGSLGAVQEWFHNTAGIKIRYPSKWKSLSMVDDRKLSPALRTLRDLALKSPSEDVTHGDNPLAHQQFPSWPKGARAHAQHVFEYAGGVLQLQEIDDPRWWIVEELRLGKPPLQMWSDFGNGNWANGPDYGRNIEGIMDRLRKGKNQ